MKLLLILLLLPFGLLAQTKKPVKKTIGVKGLTLSQEVSNLKSQMSAVQTLNTTQAAEIRTLKTKVKVISDSLYTVKITDGLVLSLKDSSIKIDPVWLRDFILKNRL